MKKKEKWLAVCLMVLVMAVMTACGKGKEEKEVTTYQIYCVNYDETGVLSYDYTTESKDSDAVLLELFEQLRTVPERLEYKAPMAGEFTLLNYSLAEGQLLLNFDENYKKQEILTEILTRAAIVRTLMQVQEVKYVSFVVNNEPLQDASGNVVGVMNNDTFINNAGNEINTYEKAKIKLYFANEAGDGLVTVSRTKVYSSNVSLERLIVEELIAGPKEGDTISSKSRKSYPVMNADTKIIDVNVRDGICYVNLNSGFLNQTHNVTPEVTIFALSNSLAEIANVNKVQISINGETNVNYREAINLSTVFERNLDLVEQ